MLTCAAQTLIRCQPGIVHIAGHMTPSGIAFKEGRHMTTAMLVTHLNSAGARLHFVFLAVYVFCLRENIGLKTR